VNELLIGTMGFIITSSIALLAKMIRKDRIRHQQDHEMLKIGMTQLLKTVEIRELCKQIQSLVGVIKWGSGTVIVFLIGFFIWYVQGL